MRYNLEATPKFELVRGRMDGDSHLWIQLCVYCWIAFVLYWMFSALKRKEAKRKESLQERMRHVLPMAAAYILMFSESAHYRALGARFVPPSELFGILGAIRTVAGIGLRLCPMSHPGTNWRPTIRIPPHQCL